MPITFSPLRYPGGKTKIYRTVLPIISTNLFGNNRTYIEPFAGGAGLALELLFNKDVDRLVLNDIDNSVFCFWASCLEQTKELCEKINNCKIDIDTWMFQKNIYTTPSIYSILDIGFATLFLNRCNVSGVIRGGPIGGHKQLGNYKLDARFNKKELIKKIEKIGQNRDKIEFYNMDAITFIHQIVSTMSFEHTFINIDPPYVKKGKMLYENAFEEADHAELSNIIRTLNFKWIVTYDECELIYSLYQNFRKSLMCLDYSAGKTRKGNELLIFGNSIIMANDN